MSIGTRLRELLLTTPRKYQIQGVRFVEKCGGRALIADDMGIGKTIQSIAWSLLHPEKRPILVVCPASLRFNWKNELRKHAGLGAYVCSGRLRTREQETKARRACIDRLKGKGKWKDPKKQDAAYKKWRALPPWVKIKRIRALKIARKALWIAQGIKRRKVSKANIIICNYEILEAWIDTLQELDIQILIVDEVHRIKAMTSKCTKATLRIGKGIEHRIALSGTPIKGKAIEFYPTLHLIAPDMFPSYWKFGMEYCFTGGTKIMTSEGELPISTIVKEQRRVLVPTVNLKTGALEYKPVRSWYTHKTNQVVRVTHACGYFDCTPNHKVWVKGKGYVQAMDLQGQVLLTLPKTITRLSKGQLHLQEDWQNNMAKERGGVLRSEVCCAGEEQDSRNDCKNHRGTTTPSSKEVQGVWKPLPSALRKTQALWPKNDKTTEIPPDVLWDHVFEHTQEPPTPPTNAWTGLPNRTAKNTTQTPGFSDGASSPCITSPTPISMVKPTRTLLLSGLGAHTNENGYRGGWGGSQQPKGKAPGPSSNASLTSSRVDCVALHQPTSHGRPVESCDGDQKVYNIEVEGNHNYFANGVLVSNCGPTKDSWTGKVAFSGASHLDILHEHLKPIMIRRMKSEVLKELPGKTRTIIPVEISNRKEYKEAEESFLSWLLRKKGKEAFTRAQRAEAMVRMLNLKILAARGKLATVKQWIVDWHEETDQKLLVFGIHRVIFERLKRAFPKALFLDGTVSNATIKRLGTDGKWRETSKRQELVDRFQDDPNARTLFGQLKVAGEGYNMTATSNVLTIELGWNPSDLEQSEDRANRMGQTQKVNSYVMVGRRTIEERVLEILEQKDEDVTRILSGKKGGAMRLLDAYLKLARR